MLIRDTRRAHLHRLQQGFSSQRRLAEAIGMSQAQLNQLLNGSRSVGEKIARRIEEYLGLEPGFMDQPLDGTVSTGMADPSLTTHELKLLADYRRLAPGHQDMVRELATALLTLERQRQTER